MFSNTRALVAALTLMLGVSATGLAQSERQMELAEEVVSLSGVEALMVQSLEYSVPLIIQSIRASEPNMTQEQATAITQEIMGQFELLMPQFVSDVATIYANNMTENELDGLIDFYQSDIGRRLIEIQPQLTQQGQIAGERLGQQAVMNAMPQIQSILEN